MFDEIKDTLGDINVAIALTRIRFLTHVTSESSLSAFCKQYAVFISTLSMSFEDETQLNDLMRYVIKCQKSFGLMPDINPNWDKSLQNSAVAFAYIKAAGFSLTRLEGLYRILPFSAWLPLFNKLKLNHLVSEAIWKAFLELTLNRRNLPLYETIAAIAPISVTSEPLIGNLKSTYDLLQQYSVESRDLLAKLCQLTAYQSNADALASLNSYSLKFQDPLKIKQLAHEILVLEGYSNILVTFIISEADYDKNIALLFEPLLINILFNNHAKLKLIYRAIDSQQFFIVLRAAILMNKQNWCAEELFGFNQFILSEYNVELFKHIDKFIATQYPDAVLPVLSSDQLEKIDILERCSPEMLQYLQQIIQQFTQGAGYFTSAYDTTAVAMVMAAIKRDKSAQYDYSPMIVNDDDLFNYLSLLIKTNTNTNARFVQAPSDEGGHWRSGEIEIKNQSIKLFISDSLGIDEENFNDELSGESSLIIDLCERFPKKNISVYYGQQRRQYASEGCGIFALDDVRHLHTYARYASESIFDTLERHIKHQRSIQHVQIHLCQFPVTFLRTAQSEKVEALFDDGVDGIVTKKKPGQSCGLTAKESFKQGFFFDLSTKKSQNLRIDNKFNKMYKRVDQFIMDTLRENPTKGYRNLKALTADHTFPCFEQKAVFFKKRPVETDDTTSTPFHKLSRIPG